MFQLILTIVLISAGFSVNSANATSSLLDADFWHDGKAELNLYEARRFHYGRLYQSSVRHFLVKESFNIKDLVKSNKSEGKDIISVIKLNQVTSTQTGTYRYEQMHSCFWSKSKGDLLKFSLSHHEACGLSFKEGLFRNGQWHLLAKTYWDGQAHVESQLKPKGTVWFYEELPLRARLLVADKQGAPEDLKIVHPMTHSKAGSFTPQNATISIEGMKVTLNWNGNEDILVFKSEWPHPLASWKRPNGESLELTKTLRLDYWNRHAPGDEALLE
ncbi:MAG: hypothetical protein AAF558_07015 [Verrucomicrobiota bacterium]